MEDTPQHPVVTKEIANDDSFSFACHKGIGCFTECCRMLELALSPYDVLRLRYATKLSSSELLEQYIIEEQEPGEPFPRFYLTMVDDGRASCVFVRKDGCAIYEHRPGACRTYPLGRAAVIEQNSNTKEHFILVKEPHCLGFKEKDTQTPLEYIEDQELEVYNQFNDKVAQILQHEVIRNGFIPSKKQSELFTLALYNLDTFRQLVERGELAVAGSATITLDNDEQLLNLAIDFIKKELFSQFSR